MPAKRPVMERLMERITVDENGCWIFTGGQRAGGYGQIRLGGRNAGVGTAHRVAYEHLVGPIPDGMFLDHRCRVRTCCNPDHLRIVSPLQNMEHRAGANSNNQSGGARGVSFYPTKKVRPWHARIHRRGKTIHVGYYDTLEEADLAARRARAATYTHDDHHEWQQQEVRQ